MVNFKPRLCKFCGTPAMKNRAICFICQKQNQKAERLAKAARLDLKRQKLKEMKQGKKELSTKYLDDLWRDKTKDYYGRQCEHCGSREAVQSHHIIGRSNFGVRFDYRNCSVLCPSCHKFGRYFSAHGTSSIFTLWIIKKRGEAWHNDLVARSRILKSDRSIFLKELRLLKADNNKL